MAALGLLVMWWAPPGVARALPVEVTDGYAALAMPATAGAVSLWIDVEAPGLDADAAVVHVDGEPVALRTTPFGAGVILAHDGAATIVQVGLRVAADPDISVTVVDAEGRILWVGSARVVLPELSGDQTPPVVTPDPTTPSPSDPASSPPATTAPPSSPPPPASSPPTRPSPGLPRSGGETPAVLALASALLVIGAAVVALRKRGERA